MTPVNSVPTNTPTMGFWNLTSSISNSGRSARGLTAPAIISIPYMRTAKPTNTVPMLLRVSFRESMIMRMPAKAKRGEKFLGLSIWIQNTSL